MLKEKKIPKILYHYCSLETFEKIIKNHTIRFSDITKSNDSDEIKFLINCYYNYLNKEYKHYHNFDLVSQFMQKQIESSCDNEKTYCFCLSTEKDLLSQWRGYAANGGIAIGFNYQKLKEYINKIKTIHGKIELDKIKYVSKQNPKELEKIFNNWNNKCPLGNYNELLKCAALYKNDGFKEEKEYRMFFRNFEKTGLDNNKIPELNVNGNICKIGFQIYENYNKDFKSYYDIPITLDLINEIIIGPKLNLSPELLKTFLIENNNNEIDFDNLDILLTKLTYR